MIQDSSIKWDPQRNAFILTDKTYENNILYMQYDPRNHQVPRIYRASCWLWNYLTHTREHLPSLYKSIFGATIQDHFIFVVVFEYKKLMYYRLDLRQKNKRWDMIQGLSRHFETRTTRMSLLQNRFDGKISIVLQNKLLPLMQKMVFKEIPLVLHKKQLFFTLFFFLYLILAIVQ